MKTKSFFTLLFAASLCFYGCEKSEIEELVIPETPAEELNPDESAELDDTQDDITDEGEDDEFFNEPGDGTRESPYTVPQAVELVNSGDYTPHKGYYVKGRATESFSFASSGTATYYISASGEYWRTDLLYVYGGHGLGGEQISGDEYLSKGDKLIVYGVLTPSKHISNTVELMYSQICYLNGATTDAEEFGYYPEESVYYNDFDRELLSYNVSEPLIDSDCWKNETGLSADCVDYNLSGNVFVTYVSERSGNFTDYAGSDGNCISFREKYDHKTLTNYFVIKGISLPSGVTDYTLFFGSRRELSYGEFSHDDFKVYISDDGNRWTELLYKFPNGDAPTRSSSSIWDFASSAFSLPSQTPNLYIYFTTDSADGYFLDDVCLMATNAQGVSVNFSSGIELPGYTVYEGDGTQESPYKVSQAYKLANSGEYDSDKIYFVKGVVTPNLTRNGDSIAYNISESGYYRYEPILYVYGIDGFGVSSYDEVVVYGKLSISDDGTPQIADGGVYSQNDDVSEGFDEDICQYMTDSDFISYCINNFDTNKNGRISFAEGEAVTTINCSTATDFTGIEYFPNLQSFTSTSVRYIDLSGNAELTTVKMNGAPVVQLDLSNNIKLTTLGANAFDKCGSLTSITLPESLTEIGNYAFRNCSSLPSITIPDGVTKLGGYAFASSGLTSVTLPEGLTSLGNYVFQNCASLVSVYVPGSLESWGTLPFDGCSALATVTLGDGLTSICEKAFYNCTALKSVTIPSSLTKWGDYAFANSGLTSVTLPEGLTTIGGYAFSNCTALASVTIPSSVSEWGGYAFSECTSLKTLTLGDGLTAIGERAFYKCTALTSATIPSSLTEWGSYAFANSGLTSITLPEGLKTIGANAFYNCTSLTSATIPSSVSEWGGYAFANSGLTSVSLLVGLKTIGEYAFYKCADLTSVVIPSSVTEWGDYAFYECTGLTTVTLSDGLATIGGHAFSECTGLKTITFADDLQTIGEYAFYKCTDLSSIKIPCSVADVGSYAFANTGLNTIIFTEGLKTIGDSAFRECTGLTSLSFPGSLTAIGGYAFYGCACVASALSSATIPPSLGSEAFNKIYSSAILYVPSGSVTAYKNTDWTQYFKLIESEDGDEDVCQYMTDSNFIEYCLSNFDLTGNGKISFAEAESVTSIDCSTAADFTGIEYFTNLQSFTSTSVKYIDLSNNTELTSVNMNGAPIEQLDLSYNTKLTTLGLSAFSNCTELVSIDLPKELTSIGRYAFFECSNLISIDLPEGLTFVGNYAFYHCKGLTSVSIPSSLTSWGSYTFAYSGVTDLMLSDGLTTIGEYAFYTCTGLTSVSIPSSLTEWGDYAFASSSLKSVTLPEGLSAIGRCAFESCTGLTSISIPSSLVNWGDYAFSKCTSLVSADFPEGLTAIGSFAFFRCSGLPSVSFPKSLGIIGYAAFYNCDSLTSISFSEGSETIIGEGAFHGCDNLTYVSAPANSVSAIYAYAFRGCDALTSVTFREGLTTLSTYAFYQCSYLNYISLAETNVEVIDEYAFKECTRLKTVLLPETVTVIKQYAFYDSQVTKMVVYATTPPNIGYRVFERNRTSDQNVQYLYVPSESLSEYEKDVFGWAEYFGHILSVDEYNP